MYTLFLINLRMIDRYLWDGYCIILQFIKSRVFPIYGIHNMYDPSTVHYISLQCFELINNYIKGATFYIMLASTLLYNSLPFIIYYQKHRTNATRVLSCLCSSCHKLKFIWYTFLVISRIDIMASYYLTVFISYRAINCVLASSCFYW